MKFSSKILKCGLSPMRKFHPYAVAAEQKGRKIYHLNIGQPDIETPKAFFDAVKHFEQPVLAYAARCVEETGDTAFRASWLILATNTLSTTL